MDNENPCPWGTRKAYLMALLCQTMSSTTFIALPTLAITHGAVGYIIVYVFVYIFIGIPLLYMEFIVSQFTTRDCLSVWRIRACLSHIGYIQIIWQMFLILYSHTITSFILHYLLISFEDPIPYYVCGNWSTSNCDILVYNYTLNQECIKLKLVARHCENLYTTFPEYQYWRNFVLGSHNKYYIAWRVSLASGIGCLMLYLSCFKRKKSAKCVMFFLIIYTTVGYTLFMMGAMLQKGIVVKYDKAMDTNFSVFLKKFRFTNIVQQVLYALNIGTGISFNLGSSTSFRAPCYANIVITSAVCVAFSVMAVCTVAMVLCPYAYEFGTSTKGILSTPLSLNFEIGPRLLSVFEERTFWLILMFSCYAVLGLSTNVIFLLTLVDMFATRFSIVEKYPGLTSFVTSIVLFIITTPLLGNIGVYSIFGFRRSMHFVTIFIGMIESFVFVVWYGLAKFSEDVHFMQGIQPSNFMKLSWLGSTVLLAYVFCNELYDHSRQLDANNLGDVIGWWTLWLLLAAIVVIAIVKIVMAACNHKYRDAIKMNPMWGPRSEVLLRSRAMFSAQAMTKEYIYRQYHLQAGILARQRAANIRREYDFK